MQSTDSILMQSRLVAELRAGGVQKGDVLCVHTALKKLGLVIGGVRTIVQSLIEAVGDEGTLLMPSFSGDLSDPAEWKYPAVPEADWDGIRSETPAYDAKLTPTRGLGAVPEYFRHYPGVIRSPHPQSSFCAWGKLAEELVGTHPLSYRFGPDGPLGRFARFEGKVLMLAAPLNTSSFYYLGFYPVNEMPRLKKRSPIVRNGETVWAEFEDIAYYNTWFSDCTEKLIHEGLATRFPTGEAESVLIRAGKALPIIRQCCLASRTQ